MGFVDMIYTLDSYEVSDVLLPFILIFTIVFAILQKSAIFDKKNYNVIVSLVLAFSVVIPHVLGRYPPGRDVVDIMNSALPNVSLIIVAILMVMLMIGFFGGNLAGTSIGGFFALASIGIVIAIFGSAAGLKMFSWIRIDNQLRDLIVIILVFGVIVWFITKEDKPSGDSGGFFSKLDDMGKELFNKP